MAVWPAVSGRAKFFGSYTHTLDQKGRLTLPAKFRTEFGERLFVTPSQFQDPCLVLWTVDDFTSFSNNVSPEQWQDPEERRRLRTWSGSTFEIEIDRLGRVGLPLALRETAALEREVLVHGNFGTIELWSPEGWVAYQERGLHNG